MAQFIGSPQQQAIWESFEHDNEHIMIEALAGTGKTSTIVEALKRLQRGQTAAFVAFNKSIATELQTRVPKGVQACTLHSLGFAAVRQQIGRVQLDENKTISLLPQHMEFNTKLKVAKLVSLCKATLCDGRSWDELDSLAAHYDVELNGEQEEVFSQIADVLQQSKDKPKVIDFDDMIWLPVVWGLKLSRFDVLMVDEFQDTNRAQQELVLAAGRRIVVVGDKQQAIYGFRGADVEAMERFKEVLSMSPRGLKVFPLTVTRRCPQEVTSLAASIVPEFECAPEVKSGSVIIDSDAPFEKGHMVLSRTNAPLIQSAYALIQQNVPVKIQGRDIGKNLTSLIKKLVGNEASCTRLLEKLNAYHELETAHITAANKGNVDAKLQALDDKVQCIQFLCEGMDLVSEVLGRIELLFSDVENGDNSRFVLLSSVHRAKGLESDVVHIICPDLLPHPMAKLDWQRRQEYNLKYVAITRAKDTLHVHGRFSS